MLHAWYYPVSIVYGHKKFSIIRILHHYRLASNVHLSRIRSRTGLGSALNKGGDHSTVRLTCHPAHVAMFYMRSCISL